MQHLFIVNLVESKFIQNKREVIWNKYFKSINKLQNNKFSIPYNNKEIKSAYHTFSLVFKNVKIEIILLSS